MSASLITTRDYSKRVVDHINRARQRIYVLSMIIQQHNDARDIITALTRAAHRGVEVSVIGDAGTQHFIENKFTIGSAFRNQAELTYNISNRLRSSAGSFRWLALYSPFLFAGRTHSKWIVIDDTVYSFGGINLYQGFRKESDFMVAITDKHLADSIVYEHISIARADSHDSAYRSTAYSCRYGSVLIDGGLPGDSIIYRHAVDLIQRSSTVTLVTQYCPTGKLAQALLQGSSMVYYNSPGSADLLTNALIRFGRHIHNVPSRYRGTRYIHAKYIIATLPNGTKEIITGSHNFISYGGLLGTREIALQSRDQHLVSLLESFHQRHIA